MMHDRMLESNREDVKLEAMRSITVMTAKGKLSVPRTLFPHIVKNVSSKNPELKKLIYLYLTCFADQEPDLALLPVATLQKSLKSPNPLVRSSALKVLTSMRLNILSAILMATLRNSVNDLSPYVRKTVAHSIIKIHRLDASFRPDLIEYIERLFNDKNSMVLSSAVAAFELVCPERLDLVQKHYRRFCFILADCNEWGQTLFVKLLMRYIIVTHQRSKKAKVDDPRILIRAAKPLVHSHNASVVVAVIKLFIATSNYNDVRSNITKPLLRLLTSHREIQFLVLGMIEELITCEARTRKPADKHVAENYAEDKDMNEDVNDDKKANNIEDQNLKTNLTGIVMDGQNKENIDVMKRNGNDIHHVEETINKKDVSITNTSSTDSVTTQHIKEATNGEIVGKNDVNGEKENGDEEEEDEEESDDYDEDEEDDDSDNESEEESAEEDEEEEDEEEEDDEGETMKKKPSNIANDNEVEGEVRDEVFEFNTIQDPESYREFFRPYIKSFFVKHSDCTQIKLAKLKILTNLSSSVNISLVMRELQAYIATYVEDKEFVSAAIHALGKCAIIVKEVDHICLNGLTNLLSNNNEHIVSEAIVVLRSQIITKSEQNFKTASCTSQTDKTGEKANVQQQDDDKSYCNESLGDEVSDEKTVSTVIKQVTKLLPTVKAPTARATILWIIANFCDKNLTAAKCAPEVLRLIAKSFCQEDNFVKLQALTLASKFLISLDKEKKAELCNKVQLLTGYMFSLAKYDINHDVRDRGRFLKKLLEDEVICHRVYA